MKKIEKELKALDSISGKIHRYQHFLDNILRDYLLALSDGAANMTEYKGGDKGSLTFRILEAASSVDTELFACLEGIVNLYQQPSVSYSKLKKVSLELRKGVLKNEAVKRFVFSFPIIKEGKLVALETISNLRQKRINIIKISFEGHVNPYDIQTAGIVIKEHFGSFFVLQAKGNINDAIRKLSEFNIKDIEITHASLEEIFLEYYSNKGQNVGKL